MKSTLIFLGVVIAVCIAMSIWSKRSSFDVNKIDLLGLDEEAEKIVNNDLEEVDRNV